MNSHTHGQTEDDAFSSSSSFSWSLKQPAGSQCSSVLPGRWRGTAVARAQQKTGGQREPTRQTGTDIDWGKREEVLHQFVFHLTLFSNWSQDTQRDSCWERSCCGFNLQSPHSENIQLNSANIAWLQQDDCVSLKGLPCDVTTATEHALLTLAWASAMKKSSVRALCRGSNTVTLVGSLLRSFSIVMKSCHSGRSRVSSQALHSKRFHSETRWSTKRTFFPQQLSRRELLSISKNQQHWIYTIKAMYYKVIEKKTSSFFSLWLKRSHLKCFLSGEGLLLLHQVRNLLQCLLFFF